MKKLSEINEGMFSGIIRRSNSEQKKKEDRVPEMTRDEMFVYIREHYEPLYHKIPNKKMDFYSGQLVDGISFPVIYVGDNRIYRVRFNYNKDKSDKINEIYFKKSAIDYVPGFFDLLNDKFKIDITGDDPNDKVRIFSKNGNKDDVNAEFCIYVIDTVLKNIDNPAMKKVK